MKKNKNIEKLQQVIMAQREFADASERLERAQEAYLHEEISEEDLRSIKEMKLEKEREFWYQKDEFLRGFFQTF